MDKGRRIGVHTSIAGGLPMSLERARELGCGTMQIFSHNPRSWAINKRSGEEICRFRELRERYDISPLYIHTSYLINLAARDRALFGKSVRMVTEEMHIAESLGADYVVIHTGSASGTDPSEARRRVASALREVSSNGQWRAGLILENTAGERGDITSRIRDISEIIDLVPGGLIAGLCIDSCHAFSAGYDVASAAGIGNLAEEIRSYSAGLVKLLHLNDSKGELGAGLDRHEHIGKGRIGFQGIRTLLNHPDFREIPVILETPKKSEVDDRDNLCAVRQAILA